MRQIHGDKEEEPFIKERISGWRMFIRLIQGVVALLVLFGLVYFPGLYQYFFYQRTSPRIEQRHVEVATKEEMLQLSVVFFILQSEGSEGSERSIEDVERLAEQAERVWNQANIRFSIESIREVEVEDEKIIMFRDTPQRFLEDFEEFREDAVNVFLVGNLRGINGISFGGTRSVAVADYTSVYDFRVLAHEIGHALSLDHIPEQRGRLMYQGANGFNLTAQEITRSRSTLERLYLAQKE